ncbi:MAG: hypothetical protein QOC67_4385, partial [Pseudonocardiales bacterium]|nr:hypothetical protein [Pseudonocardiales bacterium]
MSTPDVTADHPIDVTTTPEWSALTEHHTTIADTHLREFFAD